MAEILKGAPVAEAINERTRAAVESLAQWGITPTLAIVRVGEREDDLSYERGATKRCAAVGVAVKNVVFPEDVSADEFFEALENLNYDDTVHGILLFRPLPKHLDSEKARQMISPLKDVDGCTDASLAGVFTGSDLGFVPCTAQAVAEILDYYQVDCKGKDALILGRSLVVGRPAAMLLMQRGATVTISHSQSTNVPQKAQQADILVACMGKMQAVDSSYLWEGQTVIDVGIHFNEETQKLCGDVRFDQAENLVAQITPVPGGVGTVTTSVLVNHVAEAAKRFAFERM